MADKKAEPKKEFDLSAAEKAQIDPHIQKWLANARRTDSMTPDMKATTIAAMKAIYQAMNLKPVEEDMFFFARSPLEGRIIAGLMALACFLRKESPNKMTPKQMEELKALCRNLPMDDKPDLDDFLVVPYDIKKIIKQSGLGKDGLDCIRDAHRLWHGGNQSAASEAYISFYKDVCHVDERFGVDFGPWPHYEIAAKNCGPRFMHDEFVVLCDFFSELHADERDRPHNTNGPFVRWRDGTECYYVHNVRVPAWIIKTPDKITWRHIDKEQNAEIRRVMLDLFGIARYLEESGTKVVATDKDMYGRERRLFLKELRNDEAICMVEVTNSTAEHDGTFKKYTMRVDPNAYNGRAGKECMAAVASTWRYKRPGAPLFFEKPEDYQLDIET